MFLSPGGLQPGFAKPSWYIRPNTTVIRDFGHAHIHFQIGINYKGCKGVNELKGCANDVAALHKLLVGEIELQRPFVSATDGRLTSSFNCGLKR